MSYLVYNGYRHNKAEVTLQPISRTGLVNECSIVYGFVERWLIRGFLQANTAALLTAAIAQLEAAYSFQGGVLGFFNDDGSPTAHGIFPAQTLGGVRIIGPPSYPTGEGAEYAVSSSYRTYEITVEFTRRRTDVNLLNWTESVQFSAGGPRVVLLETLNTPPQKQTTQAFTTYRAVQRGTATGQFSRPTPPPPIWPGALVINPEIEFVAPKRYANDFADYGISWTYTFASATPLSGEPTPWPYI